MRLFRTLQSLTAEQQLNTNQYIASKFIPLLQGKLFQDATCNGLISFTLFQKRQWRTGYVSLTHSLLEILPEKRVLKLVKWFSGHCRAIKS